MFHKYVTGVLAGTFICFLALFASNNSFAQPSSNLVSDIVIVGNNRIDNKYIMDKIKTTIGQYYSENSTKQDYEKLMESGEFDSVEIEQKTADGKVVVTYRLQERSIINSIRIIGEQNIKLKKIEKAVKSKALAPLNLDLLKKDIERIKELYVNNGYADAEINYNIEKTDKPGEVDIVINIDEGGQSYVRKVYVSGNEHISDFKIKWAMQTKPRFLLLFRKGIFDEYNLKEDEWRIRELFQEKGYAEAKVSCTAKPIEDGSGVAVYVNIEEGLPHIVGKITIRQRKMEGFLATNLFYQVRIYKGEKYSPQLVEKDVEGLGNYYKSFGYADVDVKAKALQSSESNEERKVIDIYYEVKEKSLFNFGEVTISGNKRTKDIVIRRELNIMPADKYNYYRLATSKNKLINLDYFESVEVRESPSQSIPNAKDIHVIVKEKNTGRLGFGAGYSSVDQFVGFVEISQSNFDYKNWRKWFVGGGQKVRLRAEIGNKRQDVIFRFTEPYFLYEKLRGRKVSVGFDVFARNHEYLAEDYKVRRIGADLRAATPINFNWIPVVGKYIGNIKSDLTIIGELINVEVEKSIDYDDFVLKDGARPEIIVTRRGDIRNIRRQLYSPESFAEKDKYLEEEEGTYFQVSPVLTLSEDTRDSLSMPTRGFLSKFTGKVSFGKEFYGVAELKHAHYFKLFETFTRKPELPFSGPHVLQVRGSLGFASDATPMFDRFFMGGPGEMRGFAYRMAGPKDYSGNNPLGGTKKLFGSLEYTFPIYSFNEKYSVRGAVFVDAGNVWWKSRSYEVLARGPNGRDYVREETRDNSGEINASIGFGLLLNMPIGPVRLDYGIPIMQDSESDNWEFMDGFSFNVGLSF